MTKERLRRYQKIKKEQQQIRQQLEEVEAALYFPKIQRLTGMPSNPSHGNPQEDLAIRHLELQELYEVKLAELICEQLAIEEAISALDDTARMLCRHRYIEGLTWEEVCVAMGYSWTNVHLIHREALKRLNRMAPEGLV